MWPALTSVCACLPCVSDRPGTCGRGVRVTISCSSTFCHQAAVAPPSRQILHRRSSLVCCLVLAALAGGCQAGCVAQGKGSRCHSACVLHAVLSAYMCLLDYAPHVPYGVSPPSLRLALWSRHAHMGEG